MIRCLCTSLFLILLNGCDPFELYNPTIFHEDFRHLEQTEGWHFDELIAFPFTITDGDAGKRHNVYINIIHTRAYPNRNLWVEYSLVTPDGDTTKERKELPFANQRGVWYGMEFGNRVDQKLRVKRSIRFGTPGEYQILLRHIMRRDYMPDVKVAGIRIEQEK